MDMKSLLKKLVQAESPSFDKAAVDRVGDIVANEARRLGAQVEHLTVVDAGNHLIARWGVGEGGILLIGHMDTVFPIGTLANMPFHDADGKIYGPGILDMKAGIVIGLAAIEKLQNSGSLNRPVTLLCTSDEEAGSLTSEEIIVKLAKESELVLVLEPALPDGSLKSWRKGVGEFQVKVKGRSAHAGGNHDMGRNAIEEISHQIIAIQEMTDYEKGTTLNVGVIHGGTVSNVVPDEAIAQVDVRVMQLGEWERVETRMLALEPALEGTSLEITGRLNRPPMPFDETMKTAFEKAKAIGVEVGFELKAGGTGGGSDANFIAPMGIPVLDGLGAIGEGLHSEREFILADSLEERARLLAAIIEKW